MYAARIDEPQVLAAVVAAACSTTSPGMVRQWQNRRAGMLLDASAVIDPLCPAQVINFFVLLVAARRVGSGVMPHELLRFKL